MTGQPELVPGARPNDLDYWVDICRADLKELDSDFRWAHSNGHWPSGRWIDAERGVDLSEGDEERLLRAARLDIGLGDHRSRVAIERATSSLAYADAHLGVAVAAGRTRSAQPALARPDQHRTLQRIVMAVTVCRLRLDVLAEDDAFIADTHRADVVAQAHAAADLLDLAVNSLGRALNVGPTPVAMNGKPCKICAIRPRRSNNKRCEICKKYKDRNGRERPRVLDQQITERANEAAARRRKRGEGWGFA